jgi:uncharacterized protein YwqG
VPDRRRFFKELLREAAGAAEELRSVLRSVNEPDEFDVDASAPPLPAVPATRSVDDDVLLALCRDQGLEHRGADVRAATRTSLRLTPGNSGRSRLGGAPDLPSGVDWPTWNGRELAFLGQVSLADVAAVADPTALPSDGLVLFFFDLDRRPSGLAPAHRGSCRVLLVPDGIEVQPRTTRAPALRELPVELSRELMLPSAWSLAAEPLELSADEMDAWEELRTGLAHAQGVELEEAIPEPVALHRLLGYPEEIGREIEIDCQLASAGLDADDVEVYLEARSEHEPEARHWRLLFQLSADDSLGTSRYAEFRRFYVCIRDGDLRVGALDGAWAVLR